MVVSCVRKGIHPLADLIVCLFRSSSTLSLLFECDYPILHWFQAERGRKGGKHWFMPRKRQEGFLAKTELDQVTQTEWKA